MIYIKYIDPDSGFLQLLCVADVSVVDNKIRFISVCSSVYDVVFVFSNNVESNYYFNLLRPNCILDFTCCKCYNDFDDSDSDCDINDC